jgi:diaminopimelate decarboxylase
MQRLRDEQAVSRVLRAALKQGLLSEEDTAVILYDLDGLAKQVKRIARTFPPATLHAVAVKANPLFAILTRLHSLGTGSEAASLPELHLALAAGFPPEKIVFDSPAKTVSEIRFALEKGVCLNADNLDELERIGRLVEVIGNLPPIGVRINPQVGEGAIASTSVAGRYSKFGVPIGRYRDELHNAFARYPWLKGVHLHVGSQGCGLRLLTGGVKTVYDFALEVEERLGKGRIEYVDIGGGLPVSYRNDDPAPRVEEYGCALREACPELFSDRFRLLTEFGRHVHANVGWAAARVEYVKEDKDVRTAVIHVGADLFLRTGYYPDQWPHHLTVLDSQGGVKTGTTARHNIAGPLCFSGDFLARGIDLPAVEPGDYIVVHDAGAYTLSMWSRYNSRQIPKVMGYEGEDSLLFHTLREREKPEDAVAFWR